MPARMYAVFDSANSKTTGIPVDLMEITSPSAGAFTLHSLIIEFSQVYALGSGSATGSNIGLGDYYISHPFTVYRVSADSTTSTASSITPAALISTNTAATSTAKGYVVWTTGTTGGTWKALIESQCFMPFGAGWILPPTCRPVFRAGERMVIRTRDNLLLYTTGIQTTAVIEEWG